VKTADLEDEAVKNTLNSFINNEQIKQINNDGFKKALVINKNYQSSKRTYEITLLRYLVKKYQEFDSGESNIIIKAVSCYEKLVRKSKIFLEELDKKLAVNAPVNEYDMRLRAKSFLKEFIEDVNAFQENDHLGNDDANKAKIAYPTWKKKLSEMVNIWDLYSNNGNELKLTHKYLQVKKFFIMRQFLKQNSIQLDAGRKSQTNVNTKNQPFLVLMQDDLIRYIIDFMTAFFLIYSLIASPMRMFLGYSNPTNDILNKLCDVYFFLEVIFNLRTVYKDKSNNIVYDTNSIFMHYFNGFFLMDLFTTLPIEYMFIYLPSLYSSLDIIRSSLKTFRVVKLIPIITKLEQSKAAVYFRLLKICIVLFFFSHWLGCIIFSISITALDFSVMNQTCYFANDQPEKDQLRNTCTYLLAIYQGAYILGSQYDSAMRLANQLVTAKEYGVFIAEYMIGQLLGAYVFGGMTSIIQNLNQGENFFNTKIDMLNEHMVFYDISNETQNDIRTYYSYLWQRHRDVIYGREHFNLLSLSLKEKFEVYNLRGNEIYLAIFYNLNIGSPKIVGYVLMGLKKTILFPYEILFEEGSVSKGLYVLQNGSVHLIKRTDNFPKTSFEISIEKLEKFKELKKKEEMENEKDKKNLKLLDESLSYIYPMIPALIKTGRNWQTCYSEEFTDLFFLPMTEFDKIIENFPVEMHSLKAKTAKYVEERKIFDNKNIFEMISVHSSRSVGKYYEKKYNKFNIWVPIPIPISQKKIARNYVNCFMRKVNNHVREIMKTGDINIGFNSSSIIQRLQSSEDKGKKNDEVEVKNVKNNNDVLEDLKTLATVIESLTKHLKSKITDQ
jgi:hypothetical protein